MTKLSPSLLNCETFFFFVVQCWINLRKIREGSPGSIILGPNNPQSIYVCEFEYLHSRNGWFKSETHIFRITALNDKLNKWTMTKLSSKIKYQVETSCGQGGLFLWKISSGILKEWRSNGYTDCWAMSLLLILFLCQLISNIKLI